MGPEVQQPLPQHFKKNSPFLPAHIRDLLGGSTAWAGPAETLLAGPSSSPHCGYHDGQSELDLPDRHLSTGRQRPQRRVIGQCWAGQL